MSVIVCLVTIVTQLYIVSPKGDHHVVVDLVFGTQIKRFEFEFESTIHVFDLTSELH